MYRPSLLKPTLVVATALALSACMQQDDQAVGTTAEIARPAKIVPVTEAEAGLQRTYPGTLQASEHVDLAFRVGGQLIELPATPGLRVKQGQLLALIDEADYRNSYVERQARFDLAQIQHDQIAKLREKNLSSQLQFDQAKADLKSARAALTQARENVQYTRLEAPFDGVVARVDVDNFQSIQAKSPVLQLQDDSQIDIHFSVPESLISQLKVVEDPSILQQVCGQARFFSQPGKSFKACYKEHEATPDPITRGYGSVFTLVEKTDFPALPGMSVSITVDLSAFAADDRPSGLLAPVEAVFENQGKRWVWQVNEQMRAQLTEVEVGELAQEQVEIRSGLSPDSQVIAAGISYIREGMLLKPMVKERGL